MSPRAPSGTMHTVGQSKGRERPHRSVVASDVSIGGLKAETTGRTRHGDGGYQGTQNTYKSKTKGSPNTKYGKDTSEKVGATVEDGKVGERERASPEVFKTSREQKLCITFTMTDKSERLIALGRTGVLKGRR
jgi:hypothetical protein